MKWKHIWYDQWWCKWSRYLFGIYMVPTLRIKPPLCFKICRYSLFQIQPFNLRLAAHGHNVVIALLFNKSASDLQWYHFTTTSILKLPQTDKTLSTYMDISHIYIYIYVVRCPNFASTRSMLPSSGWCWRSSGKWKWVPFDNLKYNQFKDTIPCLSKFT